MQRGTVFLVEPSHRGRAARARLPFLREGPWVHQRRAVQPSREPSTSRDHSTAHGLRQQASSYLTRVKYTYIRHSRGSVSAPQYLSVTWSWSLAQNCRRASTSRSI